MALPLKAAVRHVTLSMPHLQILYLHQLITKYTHLQFSQQIERILFKLMQRMDFFCKHISKRLPSGKALSHEVNTFTHIKGLIYKHVMASNQRFLALVIPKSWNFTVLIEAHDKLGHQGVNRTYHLVKCHYYQKGMTKDIHKCINNCALCREKRQKHKCIPFI